MMDMAEDRGRFSTLLKELDIPYPASAWPKMPRKPSKSPSRVGYPVLVRPSYVLGGQDMRIVINDEELVQHVIKVLSWYPATKC
jgi:carbamoyl-phosphate synthase large subunit